MPAELNQFAFSVTHDGNTVIHREETPTSGADLMQVPLLPPVDEGPTASSATSTSLLKTGFNENGARLSPRDQWMAYGSDESGRYEYMYTRPERAGWTLSSVDRGRNDTALVKRRTRAVLCLLGPRIDGRSCRRRVNVACEHAGARDPDGVIRFGV